MSASTKRILHHLNGTVPPVTNINLDGIIDAFGLTALVGYEAETNHCVGLCTSTYTDYHYHLALARTDTYIYRTRSKHRLIHACIQGNVKWFQLLWKAGNIENMIHLRYEDENLLYYLLANAQVDPQYPHPDTLNRLTILRILLASPIDTVNVHRDETVSQTAWYYGPLNLAIFRYNYALANELLKYSHRIDPNKPDRFPPILAVTDLGFREIGVQMVALPQDNLGIILYNRTVLQWAVDKHQPSVIEHVFLPHQNRIDINYMNNLEEVGTALHIAVDKDWKYNLVPLLLSFRNIDINITHPRNGSPLHYSLKKSNIEAAKLLLACSDRINVHVANPEGQTPLALACEKGFLELVQTILSFPNVNINTKDIIFQRTPLHEAISAKAVEIVKLLVQDSMKCDVNIQNILGNTPLHLALTMIKNNHTSTEKETVNNERLYEIVRTLAAVPTMNFNLQDNKHRTVFDLAMLNGDPTIVNELVKYKDRFDEFVRQKYNL